jgi:hypothetical protein
MALKNWVSRGLLPVTETAVWINPQSEREPGKKLPRSQWGADLTEYLPTHGQYHKFCVGRFLEDKAIVLDFNNKYWNRTLTAALGVHRFKGDDKRLYSDRRLQTKLDIWDIDAVPIIIRPQSSKSKTIGFKLELKPNSRNKLYNHPSVKTVAAYWCWEG